MGSLRRMRQHVVPSTVRQARRNPTSAPSQRPVRNGLGTTTSLPDLLHLQRLAGNRATIAYVGNVPPPQEHPVVQRAKPAATKAQSKVKREVEKAVSRKNLDDAKSGMTKLGMPYSLALARYKLEKHAGKPNAWTPWFILTRQMKATFGWQPPATEFAGKGGLEWVTVDNRRFFLSLLTDSDTAERDPIVRAMVTLKADLTRLVRDPLFAGGLSAAAPEAFQKHVAPLWGEVATKAQATRVLMVSSLIAQGKLEDAGKAMSSVPPGELTMTLLQKREKGDRADYLKWLLALPPSLSSVLPNISWLGEDYVAGPWDWLNDASTAQYICRYMESVGDTHALAMTKNPELRQALQRLAPAEWGVLVNSRPGLRITVAAEDIHGKSGADPTDVDAVIQAVFDAFIGDMPTSGLLYSTNTLGFSPVTFLTGKGSAKGAPCMTLSAIFGHLLQMWPQKPQMTQQGDDRPLLTKPLASIGNRGTLTRSTSFSGNVKVYGDLNGYDTINRVFFGDGHIWLEANGKEYDPTLGVSGPKGTVKAAVEAFYVKAADNLFTAGDLDATRTDEVPPGGPELSFNRSVEIRRRT